MVVCLLNLGGDPRLRWPWVSLLLRPLPGKSDSVALITAAVALVAAALALAVAAAAVALAFCAAFCAADLYAANALACEQRWRHNLEASSR